MYVGFMGRTGNEYTEAGTMVAVEAIDANAVVDITADVAAVDDAAGVGISVGTNGVSVYEHALFYFTPLLTYTPTASFLSWTYITVVYENCQPSIYINAIYRGTGLQSDYSSVFAPSELGSNINGNYVGSVDEFRVYDRVLSAAEIMANYNADLTYGA